MIFLFLKVWFDFKLFKMMLLFLLFLFVVLLLFLFLGFMMVDFNLLFCLCLFNGVWVFISFDDIFFFRFIFFRYCGIGLFVYIICIFM